MNFLYEKKTFVLTITSRFTLLASRLIIVILLEKLEHLLDGLRVEPKEKRRIAFKMGRLFQLKTIKQRPTGERCQIISESKVHSVELSIEIS